MVVLCVRSIAFRDCTFHNMLILSNSILFFPFNSLMLPLVFSAPLETTEKPGSEQGKSYVSLECYRLLFVQIQSTSNLTHCRCL